MAAGPNLAGYVLEDRLAVGGMAEVFRARRAGPAGFAKQVALKRVLPHLASDQRFVAMFLEEARLSAQLSCRNLVQVFDFGEADGAYYMAMEYVDGADLSAVLRATGRLSAPAGAFLGQEVAVALEYLHSATGPDGQPLGIVHRDVTPANILISRHGEVKLSDLGIAKTRAGLAQTQIGTLKGKLAYLSPEQARGDSVDARTDIYSLGLCLFEAVTGQPFLTADSDAALLRLAERPPARPGHTWAAIEPAVAETLQRALSVHAEARFPSAQRLGLAIKAWCDEAARDRGRHELVARVAKLRQPQAGNLAKPAPDQAGHEAVELVGRLADLADSDRRPTDQPPTPKGTEVLPSADRPRPHPMAVAISGGVLLMVALTIGLTLAKNTGGLDAIASPESPGLSLPSDLPGVTPPMVEPNPTPPTAAGPKATSSAGRDSPKPNQKPVEPNAPMPALDSRPPPPGVAEPTARFDLTTVDELIAARGLLVDDAPELFAERARLAAAASSGQASPAEAQRLETDLRTISIDRHFIDAKLQRLNARMAAKSIGSTVRQEILRRTQTALSHAVNGRYDLANRELNEIAKLAAD